MEKVIWALPFPSTAMLDSPLMQKLLGKKLDVSFSLQEDETEETRKFLLSYSGVEAFKWTYLTSCSREMINSAYDKLVDCGDTEWLQECQEISARVDRPRELHHYRIFFDDGPCIEVIGEGVSVVE